MQKVIERILNLLAFLLTAGRPVTADEIRHTVAGYDQDSDEAWRRMFERDKDLLRNLGIPLRTEPTDAWGIEFGYAVPTGDYALADPGLTDEERAALYLAAKAVRIGGAAPGTDALFKLGGAPHVNAGEPIGADLGGDAVLPEAFAAVTERRRIRFDYRDRPRRLEPYGLVHRRGHWYVVGGEMPGGAIKVFRVDRISSLALEEERDAFERPLNFHAGDVVPEAPWEAGPDDVSARVRFDPEIAWWAARQLVGSTETIELADGSVEALVRVANLEAFTGWLLSFDDQAEVLEPPELRRHVIDRVGGAA